MSITSSNKSMKVTYMAFNQTHEEVFPIDYPIGEMHSYLRCICNTYCIVDMSPTSKDSNIKPK